MNYQGRLLNGKSVQIKVENGRIDSLLPLDTGDLDSLPIIAPGLIDIQVNGFSGIDYNTLPLTEDGIAACKKLKLFCQTTVLSKAALAELL